MASSLLWIVLFSPTVLSFVVKVSPKKGVFRVGDQERVVCTVKDCAHTPEFTWGALQDKPIAATIETVGSESVVTYKQVKRNDENRLVCKAKCGEQWKQGESTVKVYEFPERPVITGHEHLVLGKPATLTCNVSAVYPGEETEVEWLWADETLSDPVEGTGNTLVSSYHLNNISHAHQGRHITCRAWHRMWGMEKIVIQTSVTLSVLYGPGEVQVLGERQVQVGETLSLRCSSEGRPHPQLRWRVRRPSGQWEELEVGQEELVVDKVTHGIAGEYQCVANNTLGERHADVTVTVQGPPRNTSLTLSPPHPIREGESVRLSCRTLSVPVGTLRLLLGETELKSAEGSELVFILSAAQLDDAGLYRCEASNGYGTHTNSTKLTVTAHPLQLELLPGGAVTTKIGSNLTLVCEASGCPHPQLSWGAPPPVVEGGLRPSTDGPHSELSLKLDNATQEGSYTCHASCGSVTTSRSTQVALFSFPSAPRVERSGSLLEGEESTFRCVLQDAYPPEAFRFRWLLGDRELPAQTPAETAPAFESSVSMTMEPSLRGRPLVCQAELLMGGVAEEWRRSSDTVLDVHHSPRNTSLTLSPPHPIREGESVTLSCRTLSVPVGTLRLLLGETELKSAEGSELVVTLSAAQLDDAGLYRCEASNGYGTHTNSTQLTVTAPPRNTTVEVFPSQRVMEGENVTICCRSVSFPPPLVTLTKLGNATELSSHNGTFVLTNLTPSDTGDYQVNVTNDLGFHTQVFTISVMEKSSVPSDGWEVLLIPAVVMGSTLASAALLLDFVLRSRKKGSYKLAKSNPSSA